VRTLQIPTRRTSAGLPADTRGPKNVGNASDTVPRLVFPPFFRTRCRRRRRAARSARCLSASVVAFP